MAETTERRVRVVVRLTSVGTGIWIALQYLQFGMQIKYRQLRLRKTEWTVEHPKTKWQMVETMTRRMLRRASTPSAPWNPAGGYAWVSDACALRVYSGPDAPIREVRRTPYAWTHRQSSVATATAIYWRLFLPATRPRWSPECQRLPSTTDVANCSTLRSRFSPAVTL